MKKKINLRLSLIALIAVIATAVGVTFVYYSLFQAQVRNDLKQNAEILLETGVFEIDDLSQNTGTNALDHLSPGNLRITWIDEDGTVLFDNDADPSSLTNHLSRPEIQQAFAAGDGESTRRSDTMNMNTFYYALLLDNGTVLRVSTQARAITSVLLSALPVIAIIAFLTLCFCVLIGHLLTRQLMKPIDEMAEDLDKRSAYPVYKELEPFAEKIRVQHENILAAAKVRQDFTANVSHELKTPITAIRGYSELIENGLIDVDAQAHIAGQIRHNAERLSSLVNDIIQLSELDHHDLTREIEPVDLLSVAEDSINDLKPLAANRNVTINCDGVSACIPADRMLIRELMDNLIQNSIRYNRENGRVDVLVRIDNDHPMLSVIDNGIGIPPDQQERVFERFYRVDKSRSRETGGTGLGLAIVKHIADIHSAEITLQSSIGEGTEVNVRF